MPRPYLQELLERLAAKLAFKVAFADNFGYAGYIEFENGQRTFFKGTSFDINPQAASRIAADKDYAAKLLQGFGYKVPEGILVFSPRYRAPFERLNREIYNQLGGLEQAIEFAAHAGFPLFVKPNEESEGRGVSRVYDIRQLVDALHELFSWTDHVLVQKPIAGNEFRVVVLDGEIISAYQRWPLQICGDGCLTIRELLAQKIVLLRANNRGKKIEPNDWRIQRELTHQHRRFDDIPIANEVVSLLPNANLSTGGEAEDLTERIHSSYRDYCASVTRDMGVMLCGVDLMAPNITESLSSPTVLEINSAPGLNNFAASGPLQGEIVERLYEKVLDRLKRELASQHGCES